MAELEWVDVGQALAAYPRIGGQAAHSSMDPSWTRPELSAGAQASTAQELLEVNRAYERKFGYVFLICADGLSAEQVMAAARQRMANDAFTERAVVAQELRKIVRLRLGDAFY
ncbi:MAG: 2-oxo-4-hydroxy-4-carboxy-5-ureidoimidazoline decarboxylase [Pseudonocardiales bacterium]|nr:2-oxo-4-hydroxy-4-carboxy-5-ureidoimidazoline decarboxylase [Pseudonocardiales bacterium]